MRNGPPIFDYLAGIHAAFAILAALREREVLHTMIDPESGRPVVLLTLGFRWNGQAIAPRGMPPRLDADGDSVRQDFGIG